MDTEAFVRHRNLLFTVAYEMLGSAADAEDVLQETWLKWAGVDQEIHDSRAYLVRITTRVALDKLRALTRRKESYVGQWLPEPLLTAPDIADDVELADSVSMAMMLVLETLAPTERAVFVLKEVFDLDYEEIAQAIGKSQQATRQIAHRARKHVDARKPRGTVTPEESRKTLDAFHNALNTGDLQGLLDLMAPDVVILGDGGGIKQAVPRPIHGADKVARLVLGGWRKQDFRVEMTTVNGHPALAFHDNGVLDTVVALRIDDGKISGLYAVRNPEKLSHMSEEAALSR